jgi:hypothetical protein
VSRQVSLPSLISLRSSLNAWGWPTLYLACELLSGRKGSATQALGTVYEPILISLSPGRSAGPGKWEEGFKGPYLEAWAKSRSHGGKGR